MEEQRIEIKTAKLAKGKGFNLNIKGIYSDSIFLDRELDTSLDYFHNPMFKFIYLAPTQALLQKWLREVHNIIVVALPYTTTSDERIIPSYIWMIYNTTASTNKHYPFTSYEEALEGGLIKGLKLIK